jgi:ribosomal-protein-alanine N-acetyltransferase
MESAMPRSEYLFSSKRLGFRLIEDADFDVLQELDTDPAVRAHFPGGALTPEQIKDRITRNTVSYRENGFGDFAAIELETGQFTGRAGFAPIEGGEIEVGYVFLKRFWGRGLAQESLRALLAWAGHNLMKKAGMRYFKTEKTRGVDCDFYEYSL